MTSIDKAATAFISIFLTSALWPNLPDVSLIIMTIVLIVLMLIYSLSAVMLGALFGFAWAASMGHWYDSGQIDSSVFQQNVIIEGVVVSASSPPSDIAEGQNLAAPVRFTMRLTKIGKHTTMRSPEVRLSWHAPQFHPQQGHKYRLLVKLKAPHGAANPHSFHYQTWLASHNIVATGAVITSVSNALLNDAISLRQQSINTLDSLSLEQGRWLQALSFGYRGDLSDDDWALLQVTGTAHLFAISGMHLGIVSGYILLLLRRPVALGSYVGGLRQIHISKFTLLGACVLCVVYAYLAGFQVPVLRALISFMLLAYLTLVQAYWRLSSIFLRLLVIFFVLFPFSILSVSFWFSFLAVLSIWAFTWRYPLPKKQNVWTVFRYTAYLQIWLSLITAPITFFIFGQLPIFALFANLLLVPWVSLVLVPLCLLGSFFMLLGLPYVWLYEFANLAMFAALKVMHGVSMLSEQAVAVFHESFPHITLIPSLNSYHMLLLVIVTLLVLTPFWPQKRMLIVLFGLAFVCSLTGSRDPTSKLLVFDVGQGTSALLKHKNTVMLFDTGPAFPSGFSMAESVLLPYFKQTGMIQIDTLFLSHLDNDHAGGLQALKDSIAINNIYTPADACVRSKRFFQDDITADIIWPLSPQSGHENNHSCVIMLHVNGHRILFAGDIEQSVEASLVASEADLKADILIAPHHGSNSSSTPAFVNAVSPQYVVFTAGYANRWGHPHRDVFNRYVQQGSYTVQTGKQGAVEFALGENEVRMRTYRDDMYNRWYYKTPD
ncbi:DNA internalization-related competence protein ComEC/Rec2 [Glaciecola sp. XM2]|uniref:DNA internalization-related competence protein ComEC/Rec2 n=1 Tax=Glaciecola sp. XM2 TaxID=1914931 RepID=UPI001BDE4508|nr:DNA internalization-related competence protein ComEC/Rec2 [Glaciecola sp. XM2]